MFNIGIKVAINDDYWKFNFPTSTSTKKQGWHEEINSLSL